MFFNSYTNLFRRWCALLTMQCLFIIQGGCYLYTRILLVGSSSKSDHMGQKLKNGTCNFILAYLCQQMSIFIGSKWFMTPIYRTLLKF